ncbi:thiamine pyrophosphate-binding protein [Tropicimonas sediminicola]|uniref:Acetolactate synthase-1/2/3 large subunit n=1 Tax=Tropicimonas sediminicola TaxID=1031541 RepID=A0A239IPD6_9RHOB|nr:thiamine pyrophosphate-binding protein [Tropicimonas sediminicola]SNS94274.1 acetolactate synthase-1/2/3 large subunit [Tropicimonas sediminicola]
MTPARHGGQILVDQLKLRGVRRVFSVPGESFLAALDGLHESGIETITCRQEGGAAMMAEAHGKLTGTPGILFVTRGPGATNASAGLHIAQHDSTPMIAFVGQIDRKHRDRDAFQEVDMPAFFGPLVKWAAEVRETDRLPEYIARAWNVALSGRPGPVVLALPEDMLSASAAVPDIPPTTFAPSPDREAFATAVMRALRLARRPLVVAGGPGWSAQATRDLEIFAETLDLPVAVSFRRQDFMDNRHPNYVGYLGVGMNPELGARLAKADVILALGTRLGETVTGGFELLDPARPDPKRMLIHLHPDPDELGRLYPAQLALAAPTADAISALAAHAAPLITSRTWTAEARADFEVWQEPVQTPGALRQEAVIRWLSDNLPEDAIVASGAGNFAAWVHRYFRYKRYGTQLAPTSGSMGYGLPAAIAAKIEHPERCVVCIVGDGCLQMTVNELSTAAQNDAAIVVLVVNNGRYGTIRMHQERRYPGRVIGTDLHVPDLPLLARAYGGWGTTVTRDEDLPAAFDAARAAGTLALIDLQVDPQALSPASTLDATRAAGLAAATGD